MLYEWLAGLEVAGELQQCASRRWKWAVSHRPHLSVCQRGPPATSSEDALWVNWCANSTITKETDGTILYRNAFAMQHPLRITPMWRLLCRPEEPAGKSRTRTTTPSKPKAIISSSTATAMANSTVGLLLTPQPGAIPIEYALGWGWIKSTTSVRQALAARANLFSGPTGLDALSAV